MAAPVAKPLAPATVLLWGDGERADAFAVRLAQAGRGRWLVQAGIDRPAWREAEQAARARAVVLQAQAMAGIDARVRRLTRLAAAMGVRRLVLALGHDPGAATAQALESFERDYRTFASRLAFEAIEAMPVAPDGDPMGGFPVPVVEALAPAAPASPPPNPIDAADQFEAGLAGMEAVAVVPGRSYRCRIQGREIAATVTAIKYREDIDSGARLAAKTLGAGQIGTVNLALGEALAFDPADRDGGAFVLVDRVGGEPVAAGALHFALRRAVNVPWQPVAVDRRARAALKRQAPQCVWFTGLPGSGKSTLANLLEQQLHSQGRHTYLLDGDNVRHGLNRDLGFSEADRVENIRRVAEVARLMVDAGLVVIVAFISPFRAERRRARELFEPGEFVEVFVDAPLATCERRDPKGLYAKARRGNLVNFTGVDSPYEAPEAPELRIDTAALPPEACVRRILEALR